MKQFEYKIMTSMKTGKALQAMLDEQGQDGWELAAVSLQYFYYKREINSGEEQ